MCRGWTQDIQKEYNETFEREKERLFFCPGCCTVLNSMTSNTVCTVKKENLLLVFDTLCDFFNRKTTSARIGDFILSFIVRIPCIHTHFRLHIHRGILLRYGQGKREEEKRGEFLFYILWFSFLRSWLLYSERWMGQKEAGTLLAIRASCRVHQYLEDLLLLALPLLGYSTFEPALYPTKRRRRRRKNWMERKEPVYIYTYTPITDVGSHLSPSFLPLYIHFFLLLFLLVMVCSSAGLSSSLRSSECVEALAFPLSINERNNNLIPNTYDR